MFVYTIQLVVKAGYNNMDTNYLARLMTEHSPCWQLFTHSAGCIVYTNIYRVVKPVRQPVWQQTVSCKRGFGVHGGMETM